MVDSSSHLGRQVFDSVIEELIKLKDSLSSRVGEVEGVPYVPVPLGELNSVALIQDMYDHDAWLRASCPGLYFT